MDEREIARLRRRYESRLAALEDARRDLDAALLEARASGMSLRKVAELTGRSYARVFQIERRSA